MELIYKRAGHIEVVRYRDSKRYLFNGVVQSLAPSITNNKTDLEDGNSDWPHVYSMGKAGNVTVNLNSFVPELYAALVTAEYEEESDLVIRRIEEIAVPSESPYTVSLVKTPEATGLVVMNSDNSPFVSDSTPAAGQYNVSGSTLEFNSADAETNLVVAYDYEASTGKQTQLADKVNDDVFRITVAGEAVKREDESITVVDAITFDRMTVEGEVAMPSRQREPQGWNFTMRLLKPRPGYKVVDYRAEVV